MTDSLYKKNDPISSDGFHAILVENLGRGYWKVDTITWGFDRWHEDDFKPEKVFYVVYLESLGGDLPARNVNGVITYDSGGNDEIHRFETLAAAQEYAEFNDEYIMNNSGEYLGSGLICSDCRGMTPEYSGGVCESCIDSH